MATGAAISSDAHIGKGVAIGTKAVATCDVLPYVILVGNHARPVGKARE